MTWPCLYRKILSISNDLPPFKRMKIQLIRSSPTQKIKLNNPPTYFQWGGFTKFMALNSIVLDENFFLNKCSSVRPKSSLNDTLLPPNGNQCELMLAGCREMCCGHLAAGVWSALLSEDGTHKSKQKICQTTARILKSP